MRIIHIAAECSHVIKAGGLADVVYALAKRQAEEHQVEVILPKYDLIEYKNLPQLHVSLRDLWSYQDGHRIHNSVWSDKIKGIEISLIEPHQKDYYFSRGAIYGHKDDCTRFLYFCRAVVELIILHKKSVDVLHLHDWQSAAVALMLKAFCPKDMKLARIIYTIHNLRHQGVCSPSELVRVGLRAQDYLHHESLQDPDKLTSINLTKAGILYSDCITTVSKTYAQEILTEKEGCSLQETLTTHKNKLFGILNGIDLDQYNPWQDKTLFQRFNPETDSLEKILCAKKANKEHLFSKLNLSANLKTPLIITITRIDEQKGLEFFKQALKIAHQEKTYTYILLGSTTTQKQQLEFEKLQLLYAKSPNIHLHLTFNEPLAHLMYAAADLILIPSISEPCGLTQMIAMRNATLPIAHATGGLKESIDQGTGFLFNTPTLEAFIHALNNALAIYANPTQFHKMQKAALKKDFSFKKVSVAYEKLYLRKTTAVLHNS